jgi:hypothetical protein
MCCDLGQAPIGASSGASVGKAAATPDNRETPMEGGIIWLATIGAITALAAVILGVGIVLRRRRRSQDR